MNDRAAMWLDDGDVQFYHGDALDVLRSLPAGIAQTCVTSPPYWGLRDYGTVGQVGLEPTPGEYVANMVAVFREVRRVLRDDGTLWLNLGDSYAGGASGRGDAGNHIDRFTSTGGGTSEKHSGVRLSRSLAGLKPKDLVGIPWRVAFALQADGWYLRSDVIWSKPNPMPESVSDRPTKAHEYLFLLSKRPRYFYDADAIRQPHERLEHHLRYPPGRYSDSGKWGDNGKSGAIRGTCNPVGRNRLSVWEIATEPFPEAHFATYPQALVEPCIKAGTSERGECWNCGAPWRRLINEEATTWERTCGCKHQMAINPQIVLDPFIGSGTTALVARRHGRRCIGIDLSAEYLAIAAKRTQQLSLLGGAA